MPVFRLPPALRYGRETYRCCLRAVSSGFITSLRRREAPSRRPAYVWNGIKKADYRDGSQAVWRLVETSARFADYTLISIAQSVNFRNAVLNNVYIRHPAYGRRQGPHRKATDSSVFSAEYRFIFQGDFGILIGMVSISFMEEGALWIF